MARDRKRMVVIGAVAAGTKAAARARRMAQDLEIIIFTDEQYISYAGCGEPYYIGGVVKEKQELLARTPEYFEKHMHISVRTGARVTNIDPHRRSVRVKTGSGAEEEVSYDYLVIGTGARAIRLDLPGRELPGIFVIRPVDEVVQLRDLVDAGKVRRAAVIGAGFIGLEMVENLRERGVEVTLIEKLDHVAPTYDEDVALHIEQLLEARGVRVLLGATVEAFEAGQDGRLGAVRTDQGTVECDVAVVGVGIRPNTEVAAEAGIELGIRGTIRTNDRLQTNFDTIYAGGDCAESQHRVSGKPVWQPLGDTANLHGRVIGTNIALASQGQTPTARFPGVLGTSIFRVFDLDVGQTGLTERVAVDAGFDIEVAVVPVSDRPHYMPNQGSLTLKLVADRKDGRLLGAQVWGSGGVDKVVDTLAAALTFRAKIEDLTNLDLAYAPPFSPALGNVIMASQVMENQLQRHVAALTSASLRKLEKEGNDFIFLDVRNPDEIAKVPSPVPEKTVNIPLPQLRERLSELDPDRFIVTSCGIGARAARAYRILRGAGFEKIACLNGGTKAWPYKKAERD
jgi:NADPH-dependent 2,4-dienoyl-CoA reductase/sulfur reductase-like enzyme/rhodanese-related sulfurtransferase